MYASSDALDCSFLFIFSFFPFCALSLKVFSLLKPFKTNVFSFFSFFSSFSTGPSLRPQTPRSRPVFSVFVFLHVPSHSIISIIKSLKTNMACLCVCWALVEAPVWGSVYVNVHCPKARCLYMCVYMCMHMYVWACICVCICICVCTCTCICICIGTCTQWSMQMRL